MYHFNIIKNVELFMQISFIEQIGFHMHSMKFEFMAYLLKSVILLPRINIIVTTMSYLAKFTFLGNTRSFSIGMSWCITQIHRTCHLVVKLRDQSLIRFPFILTHSAKDYLSITHSLCLKRSINPFKALHYICYHEYLFLAN